MNWIILTLAFIGVISIIFFASLFWEIHKDEKAEKASELVYTPEEQFYASLLQTKTDLDAGAFATRKAMIDEALRHKK